MVKLGAANDNWDVTLIKNGRHRDFRKAFMKAEAWGSEAEDLCQNRCIFVYYTGHGFQLNVTQAALNDPNEYIFEMEEYFKSLGDFKHCTVVVIFDCCRETIAEVAKKTGCTINASGKRSCLVKKGSVLFLFGCDNGGKRDAEHPMVPVLENKIRSVRRPNGNFYLHEAFQDFYIYDKFCPPYDRSTSHLKMRYLDSSASTSQLKAKL